MSRLGRGLSWRRLGILIEALIRTPGTRVHTELVGKREGADWTLDQHLLALTVDAVRLGNWQRQGKRGAARPKPVSPLTKRGMGGTVGNPAGQTRDQVKERLQAYRSGAFDRR